MFRPCTPKPAASSSNGTTKSQWGYWTNLSKGHYRRLLLITIQHVLLEGFRRPREQWLEKVLINRFCVNPNLVLRVGRHSQANPIHQVERIDFDHPRVIHAESRQEQPRHLFRNARL